MNREGMRKEGRMERSLILAVLLVGVVCLAGVHASPHRTVIDPTGRTDEAACAGRRPSSGPIHALFPAATTPSGSARPRALGAA